MRALILFVCLAVGCLAQEPRPCRSPALLTGQLSVSSPSKKLMAFAKYSYDALGERIRIREIGHYGKKTFHHDVLLLYRQRVMYKINYRNHTCCKKRLCVDFHPLAIPRNSTLLAQVVLGSSSGPGEGVLVNTWLGELHMKKEPGTVQGSSKLHEHCHRVWMCPCQHCVSQQQNWMGGDQLLQQCHRPDGPSTAPHSSYV
ncbi:ependymin-2-like isoform X2 [Etheostoma spectabile]|uniref:ependymin-2-like isoform X2 n=1 Tax=Etheostoma spectabile TaxID=54343 RepID=UPI0013AFD138|nr:ependymin-2-like isoform X2 [Etheostoma spectabile]